MQRGEVSLIETPQCKRPNPTRFGRFVYLSVPNSFTAMMPTMYIQPRYTTSLQVAEPFWLAGIGHLNRQKQDQRKRYW
jgi:hypothetical protein